MTKQKFKPGDVVTLKSGGPDMTVKCYEPQDSTDVVCTWFAGNQLIEKAFPQALLELDEGTEIGNVL